MPAFLEPRSGLVRVGPFTHRIRTNFRTEAVPAISRQDNGKPGSTERQVTYGPETRVLPSFLWRRVPEVNSDSSGEVIEPRAFSSADSWVRSPISLLCASLGPWVHVAIEG